MGTEDQTKREVKESAELSLRLTLGSLRQLGELIARGPGGREVALAITKVQEAQHWLNEVTEV